MLPDGRRMHLQDGPIDLIIEATGTPHAVSTAYGAAARRFISILDELCGELPLLRKPARKNSERPRGVVARRMFSAVEPYCEDCFITPMAAVAGSIAEEIIETMTAADIDRAYVNNGGDIALHLSDRQSYKFGMVERPDRPSLVGSLEVAVADPVCGVATSGWRGRSFSLGIADAVTVLADCASAADAAATVVANAVNLPDHPGVRRTPAREISPDSDLGDLQVTRGVEPLSQFEIDEALINGLRAATRLRGKGLIHSAVLCLQKCVRVLPGLTTKSECDRRDGFPRCAVCTPDGFAGLSAPEVQTKLELSGGSKPHA
jgi:ApbE superfamily uncharacterized protein (UPF0280 family)